MSATDLLMAAAGSAGPDKLYVDDVFQTVVRTGTGATATVTTGFQPDLVWSKCRSLSSNHEIADSARGKGTTYYRTLNSNSTSAQSENDTFTAFGTTGYTVATSGNVNGSGYTYVDWVWKRAPKFFDVVTWNGDGTSNRAIPHALGVAPGMVVLKKITANTGSSANWLTWHRSTGDGYLYLNTTNAVFAGANTVFGSPYSAPSATDLLVGVNANTSTETYVAYLFAHDTSADGIIQCGSFTTDGSGNATVNLGWEPQYLQLKASSTTGSWGMFDHMRGFGVSGSDKPILYANTSSAETVTTSHAVSATGFSFALAASTTYIYLAIRRPNKPPTTGTQVYNAIARTGGTGNISSVGFSPDSVWITNRDSSTFGTYTWDKLRGVLPDLLTSSTAAESTANQKIASFDMSGISFASGGWNATDSGAFTYINHFFRRAPGVFDQVCWRGDWSNQTISHNLGVPPELIFAKARSGASNWFFARIVNPAGGANSLITSMSLNNTSAGSSFNLNSFGIATASAFQTGICYDSTGSNFPSNGGVDYTAYLFATLPGISKVGQYTGNGSSQNIEMGFSTGARFFWVKAVTATGDWWLYDSVRGIVSSTDPALRLNSTAAEVTSADAVDPYAGGLTVNQEATCSINASGVSYIYLAFA